MSARTLSAVAGTAQTSRVFPVITHGPGCGCCDDGAQSSRLILEGIIDQETGELTDEALEDDDDEDEDEDDTGDTMEAEEDEDEDEDEDLDEDDE